MYEIEDDDRSSTRGSFKLDMIPSPPQRPPPPVCAPALMKGGAKNPTEMIALSPSMDYSNFNPSSPPLGTTPPIGTKPRLPAPVDTPALKPKTTLEHGNDCDTEPDNVVK